MNPTMQMLLPFLMEKIFETETHQHRKQMDQLIEDNDALNGAWSEGFNHLGRNHGRDGRMVHNCPALRLPLVPRMSQLLRLAKNIEFDRQMVLQTLTRLLQYCTTLEDARDALPECVVLLHPALGTMARTRLAAWPIAAKPLLMHQYNKALTKIEINLAMKYLY